MTWTVPITWVASQVPTADELNTALYHNMLETEAAKAEHPGYVFTQGTGSARVTTSKYYSSTDDIPNIRFTAADTDAFIIRGPSVTVPRAASYLVWYGARQHRYAGSGRVFFMPVTSEGGFFNELKVFSTDTNTNRYSSYGLFALSSVSDLSKTEYTISMGYGATSADTSGWWAQRTLTVLPIGAY